MLFFLAGCSSGESSEGTPGTQQPVATTTATSEGSAPTTAESTTAESTTTVAAGPVWTRVPDDAAVFDGEGRQAIAAVVQGGPGLVAVGVDDLEGAVWTSMDGTTWERAADDGGVFVGDESRMVLNSVANGGPGLVAVGVDGIDPAVWTSPDGEVWSRVADVSTSGSGEMKDVVAGGPGFVAVGSSHSGYWEAATVWTSADGTLWEQTVVPIDGAGGRMQSIVAGGPGFVAVGSVLGEGGDDAVDAGVWTSTDGISWTRVPDSEEVFGGDDDQLMQAVTTGGPGFVAVGQDAGAGETAAAVWTSPDATTWTRVASTFDLYADSSARLLNSVVSEGSELTAVGAAGSAAAIWTSTDGTAWTAVPKNDGSFEQDGGAMFDVIVGGPGLVAVGQVYVGSDPDAAVWARNG